MTKKPSLLRLKAQRAAALANLRKILLSPPEDSGEVLAEAFAESLHAKIALYAASSWRPDLGRRVPPPDEPNALAHRILVLNDGAVPSVPLIRQMLVAMAKEAVGNGHGPIQ